MSTASNRHILSECNAGVKRWLTKRQVRLILTRLGKSNAGHLGRLGFRLFEVSHLPFIPSGKVEPTLPHDRLFCPFGSHPAVVCLSHQIGGVDLVHAASSPRNGSPAFSTVMRKCGEPSNPPRARVFAKPSTRAALARTLSSAYDTIEALADCSSAPSRMHRSCRPGSSVRWIVPFAPELRPGRSAVRESLGCDRPDRPDSWQYPSFGPRLRALSQ